MLKRITPQTARSSAIGGAAVWAVVLFVRISQSVETELIDKILLLAVLVIVPLGLSLVNGGVESGMPNLFYRLAVLTQPFGALAVVGSFFLEHGVTAALVASVWSAVTIIVAIYGLSRLLLKPLQTTAEISIDIGLIYLSVGSGWLVMARLGMQTLGFGDTIVLLTAVHFHFAGFVAPVLTGLAGRKLDHSDARIERVFLIATIAVTVGTPLVAAGLTLIPGWHWRVP